MLLLRDWHALLLLFVMPAAFILVMSLALQNVFSDQQGVNIRYYLINKDDSLISATLVHKLHAMKNFKPSPVNKPVIDLVRQVRSDHVQFLVSIPKGFGADLLSKNPLPIQMLAGPNVEPAVYKLFELLLRETIMRVYIHQRLAIMKLKTITFGLASDTKLSHHDGDKLLHAKSLYHMNGVNQRPSSVQQNVPAWLVFAMFFIAIPLSITWVHEKQQGTYARLRSMGLSTNALLMGKMLPYLGVNLLQVILMLMVGVFVVPWLGGDQLTIGQQPLTLCVVSLSISLAAVSYALLIANAASTSDQAIIITGGGNLLMGAVGGIMVPRFLMPPVMRTLSQYSPMAWGLEGFLDVFLRQGRSGAVALSVSELLVFALICLILSGVLLKMRRQ